MSKSFTSILILTLGLLFFLLYAWPVRAQTPTPRDALIQAIEARARYIVENELPHESPTDLDVLFGKDAVAVGMKTSEVAEIYEAAYQAALEARSPWVDIKNTVLPNTGWLVATILAVWLLFRKVIDEYLTGFFKKLGVFVYQNLSGFRPFWIFSLKRYREQLERNYHELKLPFRPERPLEMHEVFVPLRVLGSTDRSIVDASAQLQKYERLVVVGIPGSGKTMLLRHLALTYAFRGLKDTAGQPIPVLLELNRLDNSETSLQQHLVQVLARNGFPEPSGFIQAFLRRKDGLLLLLDGLDEVSAQFRIRVVEQIRNLITEFPKVRVIITCRSQVYRHEFDDIVDRRLEIVEFNDQQIRRFLGSWEPYMPKDEGKSVEHFVRELHKRPRIMALARNPLLLSMIAYLYTDTNFVLPFSRAEFYEGSTTLLLDKWHGERNHYKANEKRIVLQGLALFIQCGRSGVDRRHIDFATALNQIRSILPSIALKDDDARPILDEIIERSGLLLAVDGGTLYQFSHLTLQEFFSALALKKRPDLLLNFFSADRDAWREVTRLWCGLEHDSTRLIKAIFNKEPLLAFECLGDAQQIESSYADWLVDTFKQHLDDALKYENLAHALALVAANPRTRGSALFAYLIDCLNQRYNVLAAAYILSLTNLPKAAEALANHANEVVEIRRNLISMGDLAVPVLIALPDHGQDWVFDSLSEINTPVSLLALVGLLWDEEITVAYKAAWRMLVLFNKRDFKNDLRSVSLTPKRQRALYFKWVWEPFDEPNGSPLPLIAGRCVYLLYDAPSEHIPSEEPSYASFDPKLVVALAIAKKEQISSTGAKFSLSSIKNWLLKTWRMLTREGNESIDPVIKYSLDGIAKDLGNRVRSLLDDPQLTPGNWRKPRKILTLSTSDFGWHESVELPIQAVMVAIYVVNVISAVILFLGSIQQEIQSRFAWAWIVWGIIVFVPMGNIQRGSFILPHAVENSFYEQRGFRLVRPLLALINIAFVFFLAYCPTMLLNYWGIKFSAVVFGLIFIAGLGFAIIYRSVFGSKYVDPLQELIQVLRME